MEINVWKNYNFPWLQVLRLHNVSTADAGVYSCTAENPVGYVAANTTITVHCKYTKLSKLLRCQKAHSFQNIKDIDPKFW